MATTWTNEVFVVDVPTPAPEWLSVTWPNGDGVEHDILTRHCVCVPMYKVIMFMHGRPDCSCVLHELVHHSLDGRELSE